VHRGPNPRLPQRSRVDHKGRIRIPRHSGSGREVARGLAEGSVRVDIRSA